MTYQRQLNNSEKSALPEVYFGLGYTVTEALEVTGYAYKNTRSSADESRIELNMEYALSLVDLLSYSSDSYIEVEYTYSFYNCPLWLNTLQHA